MTDHANELMIAGLFVIYGKDYVDLCKKLGKDAEAVRAQAHVDAMIEATKKYGTYYLTNSTSSLVFDFTIFDGFTVELHQA